jgi:hypothetical protein
MQGEDLIALIPEDAYQFHFPEGKPERKYYHPPQSVEDSRRQARLERVEPEPLTQE